MKSIYEMDKDELIEEVHRIREKNRELNRRCQKWERRSQKGVWDLLLSYHRREARERKRHESENTN